MTLSTAGLVPGCLAHNLLALHFAEGKGALLLLCMCVSVVTG